MKYLLIALLFLVGCHQAPDPIEECRFYCQGYINTNIRIGTEKTDNLYHCSCDNR